MPTRDQLRVIHNGARACGLIVGSDKTRYLLLLRNVGGVESSTALDNRGVEDVMATLEDMGFDGHPKGNTYWRDCVATRGTRCGTRAIYKIEQLARSQRYSVPQQCEQFSGGRTCRPEELTPGEAWKLIEFLKATGAREPGVTAGPPFGKAQGRQVRPDDSPTSGGAKDRQPAATDGAALFGGTGF